MTHPCVFSNLYDFFLLWNISEILNIPELFFPPQSNESEWAVKQQNDKPITKVVHKPCTIIQVKFNFWAKLFLQGLVLAAYKSDFFSSNPVFRTGGPNWRFARDEIGIHLFKQYSQCLLQLHRLWQSWRRCHHDAKIGASSTEEIRKLSLRMTIMASHHGAEHMRRYSILPSMNVV